MSAVFTKNELKSLILLNVEDPKRQAQSGLTRARSFKDRKVADVMTPLDSTFALPRNAVLSAATRPGLPRKNSMAYDPTLLLKAAGGPSGFEEHGDGIELARGLRYLFAGCVPASS
ncbi:hypothetical protein JL722_14023 [Aureococcus anophagefferens]|nr:hypothetical protein JL722_14023 [Aureococcus anophagefferens]